MLVTSPAEPGSYHVFLHSAAEHSFAGEAATKSGDASPLPSRHQALALTSESDRMSVENKYNESSSAGELSKTKGENSMIIWIIIVIAMLVNACCISEEEYIKIQKAKDNAFIKYWNS